MRAAQTLTNQTSIICKLHLLSYIFSWSLIDDGLSTPYQGKKGLYGLGYKKKSKEWGVEGRERAGWGSGGCLNVVEK